MNRLFDSFRLCFLLGFVACAALIGYALYVQFVEGLMPCDFCILQRIAFAATGLLFLVGALHTPRRPGARRAHGVLVALAALSGAAVAARHAWVQVFPPEVSMCGAGLGFVAKMQGWMGALKQVLTASGDCSRVDWTFLGLTMPMWALVWFVLLGAWALWTAFRARPAR